MRYIANAAFLAAILLFASCESGQQGNSGNNDGGDISSSPDTSPKTDSPDPVDITTTPKADSLDPVDITTTTLSNCDPWNDAFSGKYDLMVGDYNWSFTLPKFVLTEGACVADTADQSVTIGANQIVSVADLYLQDEEIIACGPQANSEVVCFMKQDDGSISIWGEAVGTTINIVR